MSRIDFREFVIESNRIEGITREPTDAELDITRKFVKGGRPTVDSVCALALVYTSGKGLLREQKGMNVRVGNHVPPEGGPIMISRLAYLLGGLERADPFEIHVQYETLHPFLDGNGRTGRALWAWQMWRQNPEQLDLGFLHAWYYQSLSNQRKVGQQ